MTSAAQHEATTGLSYTSGDVVRLTGASYRNLDYYCRTGRLPVAASGSGSMRRFTADELDTVRLVVVLTRFGLALDRAFEIARALVAADVYRAVVGDVFEVVVRVRDTSQETS